MSGSRSPYSDQMETARSNDQIGATEGVRRLPLIQADTRPSSSLSNPKHGRMNAGNLMNPNAHGMKVIKASSTQLQETREHDAIDPGTHVAARWAQRARSEITANTCVDLDLYNRTGRCHD